MGRPRKRSRNKQPSALKTTAKKTKSSPLAAHKGKSNKKPKRVNASKKVSRQKPKRSPSSNSGFVCHICKKVLSARPSLDNHLRSHDPNKANKCEQCGRCFVLKHHLKNHLRTHTGEKPHKCTPCGTFFAQFSSYHRHIQNFHTVRPHMCQVCSQGFENQEDLDKHIAGHTEVKPTWCKECNLSLTLAGEATCPHYPFKCPECGRCLKNKYHWKKHILEHSIRKIKCSSCDMGFVNKKHLEKHEKLFHNVFRSSDSSPSNTKPVKEIWCFICQLLVSAENPRCIHIELTARGYQCTKCPKKSFVAKTLQEHVNYHLSPNEFLSLQNQLEEEGCIENLTLKSGKITAKSLVCDKCGKTIGSKAHLLRHQRGPSCLGSTHAGGVMEHICEICAKSFTRKDGLMRHIKVHMNDRPYVCGHCTRSFFRKDHLKTHLLQVHGRNMSGEKTEGKIPYNHECTICHKTFFTSAHLRRHELIHMDKRQFGCKICGKAFHTKSAKDIHLRTHTGEKLYKCPICFKRYSRSDHFRLHRKRHLEDKYSRQYKMITGSSIQGPGKTKRSPKNKNSDIFTIKGSNHHDHQSSFSEDDLILCPRDILHSQIETNLLLECTDNGNAESDISIDHADVAQLNTEYIWPINWSVTKNKEFIPEKGNNSEPTKCDAEKEKDHLSQESKRQVNEFEKGNEKIKVDICGEGMNPHCGLHDNTYDDSSVTGDNVMNIYIDHDGQTWVKDENQEVKYPCTVGNADLSNTTYEMKVYNCGDGDLNPNSEHRETQEQVESLLSHKYNTQSYVKTEYSNGNNPCMVGHDDRSHLSHNAHDNRSCARDPESGQPAMEETKEDMEVKTKVEGDLSSSLTICNMYQNLGMSRKECVSVIGIEFEDDGHTTILSDEEQEKIKQEEIHE